jgi:3-phosphoglycerate kinase
MKNKDCRMIMILIHSDFDVPLNTFVILFDDARIIDVVPMMEYFS